MATTSKAQRAHAASGNTLCDFKQPGQVVLVLQGGGALGAFQAGVYEAQHEAGIEPDRQGHSGSRFPAACASGAGRGAFVADSLHLAHETMSGNRKKYDKFIRSAVSVQNPASTAITSPQPEIIMSTSIRPSLSRALPALAVAAALVAPMPQALSAFSPIATAHAASCVCAPMHACAPASKHMQQTDRASTRPGP